MFPCQSFAPQFYFLPWLLLFFSYQSFAMEFLFSQICMLSWHTISLQFSSLLCFPYFLAYVIIYIPTYLFSPLYLIPASRSILIFILVLYFMSVLPSFLLMQCFILSLWTFLVTFTSKLHTSLLWHYCYFVLFCFPTVISLSLFFYSYFFCLHVCDALIKLFTFSSVTNFLISLIWMKERQWKCI
jgi:hypothetical protein